MLGESWVRGKPLLLTVQRSLVSRVKEGLSNGLVWEKGHDTALPFPLCSPVPVSPFYHPSYSRHHAFWSTAGCLVAVAQSLSCVWLCDPMDCNLLGFSVLHYLLEIAQITSTELAMPSNCLILCRPPLLLPSIFPSIRVFSNESALRITWPQSWGFSISVSPSSEYLELISLGIDWFDHLTVQGTLKSL